jgi:hypothetical protein
MKKVKIQGPCNKNLLGRIVIKMLRKLNTRLPKHKNKKGTPVSNEKGILTNE